jgi:hypothetical protein
MTVDQTVSDTCGICGEPAVADFVYRLNPGAELARDASRDTVSLCKEHDDERKAMGDQAFFDRHILR